MRADAGSKSISILTLLPVCIIVGTVSLVAAYRKHSAGDAIGVIVIWFVLGPIFMWWYATFRSR